MLTHRTFDYPNAFAFNDPVGGPLDMDTTDAAFVSRFRLTRHFSIWSEVQYNDVSSTDQRITYDRLRGILGIQWSR